MTVVVVNMLGNRTLAMFVARLNQACLLAFGPTNELVQHGLRRGAIHGKRNTSIASG